MKLLRFAAVSVTAVAAACAATGDPGTGPSAAFPEVDGGNGNGDPCPLECSLDLRSVVRSCDGTVVETCADGLGCGSGSCVEPCSATAEAKSSLGCEFYMQPPPTDARFANSCYASYLVNAWSLPVDFEISHGGRRLDLSQSVYRFVRGTTTLERFEGPIPPGEAVVVFLAHAPPSAFQQDHVVCPATPAMDTWPSPLSTGRGASFHLTTSAPVSASTIYPFSGAQSYVSSSTLLLPVPSWGKQHVMVAAWQRMMTSADGSSPGIQVVASEDDTEVTIVPVVDIQDGPGVAGAAKKTAASYRLAKGELLQFIQSEELSGSFVEATKPVTTFGGHGCMFIPADVMACDTAQQQIPAFEQWGSEYVAVRYRGRASDSESAPYRIVGAAAGTVLDYDPAPPPGAPTELGPGDVVTFWTEAPFVVHSQDADHPFYLAAYMSGGVNIQGATGGTGDPEFVNVVPAGQYLSEYTFYADPSYTESSLVVVREKRGGRFEDVVLDCAGGPLDGWTAVDTAGKFEFRRVDLSRAGAIGDRFPGGTCGNGLQHLHSKGPFTTTLWGWSDWSSYAYPGGMAQRKLVTKPLVVH